MDRVNKIPSTMKKDYVVPNSNDILCGRGGASFNHPGNRKFRTKIAQTLDEYNNCGSRQGRTHIIREIIRYVMVEQGGRFLKSDTPSNQNQQWYDGGMKVAKIRVSTAFRDARIPNKVKCMESLKRSISDSSSTSVKRSNNDSYCSQSQSISTNKSWLSSRSLMKRNSVPRESFFSSFDSLTTYLMTTDLIPYPSPSNDDDSIVALKEEIEEKDSILSNVTTMNSCYSQSTVSQKEIGSFLIDNDLSRDFDSTIDADSNESMLSKNFATIDTTSLKYKLNYQQVQQRPIPHLGRIVSFSAQCA